VSSGEAALGEAGPPKLLDRILQRWRFSKARPFVRPGDRVLDVGCGDGAFFRYLGARLGSGLGVDSMLAEPIEGDRYRLVPGSFPDDVRTSERFDVITMLAVLEHLPEGAVEKVPHRCRDLLRPGGRVVATVPSPAVDTLLHILIRLRLMRGTAVHEHHGFEPSAVPAMFTREGFAALVSKRFELGLNNLFVFSPGS
jgi:2-polyprenyl-3-methyl-5-hydroxy-6-metoxy-1,4-benzoquinol methylase